MTHSCPTRRSSDLKVTDCGCFGDAIKLTPWQSFTKDLILLVLILPIFLYRRHIRPVLYPKGSDLALVMASVLSLGFGIYTYFYLPVIDFLPYKEIGRASCRERLCQYV